MISDGGQVSLRFAMEEVAERAFLPIRIDQKAYANLVQRGDVEKVAVMTLSDETLGAMRKGGTLQIAWLSEEAVRASLAGAAQGITDLRTCGAQVSSEHRARRAAQDEARARAAQEASAKAWPTSSSPPPAPRPPPPRPNASGCAPRPIRPRRKPTASAR
jgi:hypothetical protein